jgi:hypothetical protein
MNVDRRLLRRVYEWLLANADAEADSRDILEEVERMLPTVVLPEEVDSLDRLRTALRDLYPNPT